MAVVKPPRKRDSCYSWLVCLGAAASNGMANSIVFSFGVLMPVLMKEFRQTRERTALLGSLIFGVALFFALASGKVCHRFGCRLSHTIGTLICAASLFITSWATGITYMFLSLSAMYGVGLALTFIPCFLIVSMYFEKRQSFAIGIVAAGLSAGFFMMGPIMESLVEAIGWRNSLRTLSGIVLSTSLISILFDPNVEKPPESHRNSLDLGSDIIEYPQNILGKLRSRFSFLKVPGYIIPALSLFIVSFSHWSVPIHLVRHCEEMGISSKKSSYLYLGIGIGSLIARVATGKICEIIRPVYVNQIGDVVSGISTLVLALTSNYPLLVVITLFYGLADGIFDTTFSVVMLCAVGDDQRPFAYGFANMAVSLTVSLGPMITGLVADVSSYQQALIMTGSITIIGGLVPFFLFFFKRDQQISDARQKEELKDYLLVYEKETVV